MPSHDAEVCIVGAGLAGSEAAFQLAEQGIKVELWDMRTQRMTPAHQSGYCAELVCSNSLGSQTAYSAPGQLKWEAAQLGSLILKLAEQHAVPAGMALSVDRWRFAEAVHQVIHNHPNIRCVERCALKLSDIPRPAILATGPLTAEELSQDLVEHFGGQFLYFFDAIAPIIDVDSINTAIAWRANRFQDGPGDYWNCPLNAEEYHRLVTEISAARKIEPKQFEVSACFEGCMPIETIAASGPETLRFGPMSPKGLRDPRTGKRPYAVVQLRQDNSEGTAWNMVGFQTRMAYPEQVRVFRMIPGLEDAEFLKLGSIHRNLYLNSPQLLNDDLSSRNDDSLFFAGQITGVEGYFESACVGLMVASFVARKLRGLEFVAPIRSSGFGSLWQALREIKSDFQPTNINFGLFPKLGEPLCRKPKKERRDLILELAKKTFLESPYYLGR